MPAISAVPEDSLFNSLSHRLAHGRHAPDVCCADANAGATSEKEGHKKSTGECSFVVHACEPSLSTDTQPGGFTFLPYVSEKAAAEARGKTDSRSQERGNAMFVRPRSAKAVKRQSLPRRRNGDHTVTSRIPSSLPVVVAAVACTIEDSDWPSTTLLEVASVKVADR
jgi:hypothetical protein